MRGDGREIRKDLDALKTSQVSSYKYSSPAGCCCSPKHVLCQQCAMRVLAPDDAGYPPLDSDQASLCTTHLWVAMRHCCDSGTRRSGEWFGSLRRLRGPAPLRRRLCARGRYTADSPEMIAESRRQTARKGARRFQCCVGWSFGVMMQKEARVMAMEESCQAQHG